MPRFNVLHAIEFYENNKTDSRLIILYDSEEEKYYYYGTRSRNVEPNSVRDKYIQFSGAYHESKLATFMSFLKHMNNMFENKLTVELHVLDLSEEEYDYLNFEYLYSKLSKYTELFAYDNTLETEGSMMEKIDMLTAETL